MLRHTYIPKLGANTILIYQDYAGYAKHKVAQLNL